jgi:hypothetical protein
MLPEFVQKLLERFVRRQQAKHDPSTCEHSWCVCGCFTSLVALDVVCLRCGVYGLVPDPSEAEWIAARESVTKPYDWDQPDRVVVGKRGF